MLSAQGLVQLLELAKSEAFEFLPFELKRVKIPITLSRIACQIMHSEADDGSFGNGCDEVTAYATLALVVLSSPCIGLSFISEDMSVAIRAASVFLQARLGQWKPQRIWVEKVTYSSDVLTKAYCLAALNSTIHRERQPRDKLPIEILQATKLCNLFRSVPLFAQKEGGNIMLRLAFQESQPFMTQLEHIRFDIFPRPPKVNEKYLRIIPFAWTASNYLHGSCLPATILLDMMQISMLNFQADEYIEMVVPQCKPHEVSTIQKYLKERLEEPLEDASKADVRPAKRHRAVHGNGASAESVQPILETLSKYIDGVLDRPHIRQASRASREQVLQEMKGYLEAQIMSVGAKSRRGQPGAYSSFFDWVHTSGARDTSCPFSFAYYLCLVNHVSDTSTSTLMVNGRNGSRERHSVSFEAEYLLRGFCNSLARICRMYNDYGSIRRDCEEDNLNSVDFYFEHQVEVTNGHQSLVEDDAKRAIWSIAALEREYMDRAFEKLRNHLAPKLHDAVQVFLNVTDLFGQIYVAQDIGTRTKVP